MICAYYRTFNRLVAMVITNKMDAKKATSSKTRVIVYQPVTPACNINFKKEMGRFIV